MARRDKDMFEGRKEGLGTLAEASYCSYIELWYDRPREWPGVAGEVRGSDRESEDWLQLPAVPGNVLERQD